MFSGGAFPVGTSGSCSSHNPAKDVFSEFAHSFFNKAKGSGLEAVQPEIHDGYMKSTFSRADGWTMENFVGEQWNMTAVSRRFKDGGKGYVLQARSINRAEYLPHYDIVLYDGNGRELATTTGWDCEGKMLKGDYSERQYLQIMKGALRSVFGISQEIMVFVPGNWLFATGREIGSL